MGNFRCILLMAASAVLLWSVQALSAEYYVIETRSGIVRITDHQPQGEAVVLKGPFENREAAEAALSEEEKKNPGTSGKGEGQGKGRGRGQGQGKNR
ncbi:MAG: hypothetical protein K9N21_04470 [Deltaproteobacteria bacterium]|nr:hypothetical protein [Deltaproteobacteria bacterium]